MKRTIFLPIFSLLAFLALFTVISCDKSDRITEDVVTEFDPQEYPNQIKSVVYEDVSEVMVENKNFVIGEVYKISDLKLSAPILYDSISANVLRMRSTARGLGDTIVAGQTLTVWLNDCTGYCPSLGQELKGYKNPNWIQVAASPSATPFASMSYWLDPKNLTNMTGQKHTFRHINFNNIGRLAMMFMVYDTHDNVWLMDSDIVNVPSYGCYNQFQTYAENREIEWRVPGNIDENAVVHLVQWACD